MSHIEQNSKVFGATLSPLQDHLTNRNNWEDR
jgi:hypothetical protein